MDTVRIDIVTGDTSAADLYGQRAVYTTYDGDRIVGILEPNPLGEYLPAIRFDDGLWGRADNVVEVVR